MMADSSVGAGDCWANCDQLGRPISIASEPMSLAMVGTTPTSERWMARSRAAFEDADRENEARYGFTRRQVRPLVLVACGGPVYVSPADRCACAPRRSVLTR